MKFSIKDFSSKCDQIRNFLRIWSHLQEKSLMENFVFCAVKLRVFSDPYTLTFFYKQLGSSLSPRLYFQGFRGSKLLIGCITKTIAAHGKWFQKLFCAFQALLLQYLTIYITLFIQDRTFYRYDHSVIVSQQHFGDANLSRRILMVIVVVCLIFFLTFSIIFEGFSWTSSWIANAEA